MQPEFSLLLSCRSPPILKKADPKERGNSMEQVREDDMWGGERGL